MTGSINRRLFLIGAGATAAAPYFIPARAFGANEKIAVGIIGPGGRGRSLMTEFQTQGCQFASLCDVYGPNREAATKLAKSAGSEPRVYVDWREFLEQEKGKLDALVIASPEHMHAVQLASAVKQGYDVYCEKPMSHSISEGNRIIKAVRATDRIVQVGMQRRSSPVVRKGKEIFDKGILGNVYFVRVKWNWSPINSGFLKVNNEPLDPAMSPEEWKLFCGPSKGVKFEPKKFRHWRWFWKFSGGNITDQGTHLMDVVQWYMGKEKDPVTPRSAECFGEVFNLKGVETPDVFTATMQYENFIANWTLNYTTSYQNSWSIEFFGDKGTMVIDDRGMRVYEETWEPAEDSMLVSKKAPAIVEKGPLESISHVKNFLECVKSRQDPNAPVEIGHRAVCGPHLANVAWHKKERAYLCPKAKRVTTKGWSIF